MIWAVSTRPVASKVRSAVLIVFNWGVTSVPELRATNPDEVKLKYPLKLVIADKSI